MCMRASWFGAGIQQEQCVKLIHKFRVRVGFATASEYGTGAGEDLFWYGKVEREKEKANE